MGEGDRIWLTYMDQINKVDYGRVRRGLFKDMFNDLPDLRLSVNIEGGFILKYDPDLRKLLKQGFLKRGKSRPRYGWGHSTKTYLEKA